MIIRKDNDQDMTHKLTKPKCYRNTRRKYDQKFSLCIPTRNRYFTLSFNIFQPNFVPAFRNRMAT